MLRLYVLPEATAALLCGTLALPVARREFAAEAAWDLPSLAPGETSLIESPSLAHARGTLPMPRWHPRRA